MQSPCHPLRTTTPTSRSRPRARSSAKGSSTPLVARFANAKATDDTRYLDITTVYDGSGLKDKRVLITGAEQGLGLELVKEIIKQGGHAIQAGRGSSEALEAVAAANPGQVTIITGVDVCQTEAMQKMVEECTEGLDILINCAGVLLRPCRVCRHWLRGAHELCSPDVAD